MILAGGGFFGFLIASAMVGILIFILKSGFSMVYSIYANTVYNLDSVSNITDIAKLRTLLNYWSSEGNCDTLKIEKICNRILFLYPDDLGAKMSLIVFVIFHREYNADDEIIFQSLFETYKKGINHQYEDDILLVLYLYSYYCSKNNQFELSDKLFNELTVKMPDYRIKLDAYIQAYPIVQS